MRPCSLSRTQLPTKNGGVEHTLRRPTDRDNAAGGLLYYFFCFLSNMPKNDAGELWRLKGRTE